MSSADMTVGERAARHRRRMAGQPADYPTVSEWVSAQMRFTTDDVAARIGRRASAGIPADQQWIKQPCGHETLGPRPCPTCAAFVDAPDDEEW